MSSCPNLQHVFPQINKVQCPNLGLRRPQFIACSCPIAAGTCTKTFSSWSIKFITALLSRNHPYSPPCILSGMMGSINKDHYMVTIKDAVNNIWAAGCYVPPLPHFAGRGWWCLFFGCCCCCCFVLCMLFRYIAGSL